MCGQTRDRGNEFGMAFRASERLGTHAPTQATLSERIDSVNENIRGSIMTSGRQKEEEEDYFGG